MATDYIQDHSNLPLHHKVAIASHRGTANHQGQLCTIYSASSAVLLCLLIGAMQADWAGLGMGRRLQAAEDKAHCQRDTVRSSPLLPWTPWGLATLHCTQDWTTTNRATSQYKDCLIRYQDFHYKDKMAVRLPNLYNGD